MNRTFGLLSVFAMSGALVACSPEPMTVRQVCSANDSVNSNAPKGTAVEVAKYYLPYYKEWSQRIDGALGTAFEHLAKAQEVVISEGKAPIDGPAADKYWSEFAAYKEILRICS